MKLRFLFLPVLLLCCAAPALAADTSDSTAACLCKKALASAMCRDADIFILAETRSDGMRFSVRSEGGVVDYYCRRSGDVLTLASPVWGRDIVKATIAKSGDCQTLTIPKINCETAPDPTCCP